MKISSNVVGDFNDDNNFLYKLLLANTQVSMLRKAFANNSSVNLKLSKTQFHKIRRSRPLLKTGLPLIRNVLKPLAKSVLTPLGLAAASATDAIIHKKIFGSGVTTLIISNEEMNGIIKIVKSLEESGLLIKDIAETIKSEAKGQKGGFLGMLLGTSGASLLVNFLAGQDTIRASEGRIRAPKGTIRVGQDF